MNMFMKGLFPPTLLYPEYTRAYEEAKSWSKKHLSQQQIKIYLTKYDRYSEDATQYALNKLNVDWKEQALLKAKYYQEFHYSKEKLVWQLINVERFTQEEADYAIEQGNFDWKEEAVKKAESSSNGGNISKERLLEILVEYQKIYSRGSRVRNRACQNRLGELNNSFNFDFCNILKSWTVCQLFFATYKLFSFRKK